MALIFSVNQLARMFVLFGCRKCKRIGYILLDKNEKWYHFGTKMVRNRKMVYFCSTKRKGEHYDCSQQQRFQNKHDELFHGVKRRRFHRQDPRPRIVQGQHQTRKERRCHTQHSARVPSRPLRNQPKRRPILRRPKEYRHDRKEAERSRKRQGYFPRDAPK